MELLASLKDSSARRSKSASKLAACVLDDPEAVLGMSTAALAARVGVSEPTVNRFCTGLSAGWALVDGFPFVGYRFRIGPATGVTALAALGLGQDVVDLLDNGVALGAKAHRCVTQQGTESQAEGDQRQQGGQERVLGNQLCHTVSTPARRSP